MASSSNGAQTSVPSSWPTRRSTTYSQAAFVPQGHLSYDLAARPFFTFRFSDEGEAEEDILAATARAQAAAHAWLDERGYGYKNLRSAAHDLCQASQSERQRRGLAQGGA